MKLDEIFKTGLWRLDVIRVRTAVNPLLWLVGLITPLIFITAIVIDDRPIRIGLLAFAALPIIVTIIAYFIFMFRDPDRLQSEDYRIRQRAIQLLYRKGGTTEIVDVTRQEPRLEIEDKTEDQINAP